MGQRRRGAERRSYGRHALPVLLTVAVALATGLAGTASSAALLIRAGQSPSAATRSAASATRGLWVLRSTLTSRARVDQLVRQAADNGFNTLFVQVRARGDAYFAGSIEPRGDGMAAGFDPLAHVLDTAHRAGLRVHAWVNVNFIASAVTLPTDPAHLVHTHPEWLMAPRDLAPSLAALSPRDRRYVARLAEWTRARPDRVEGLYVSPIPVAAARHLESIVANLAERYPIDGLHLDYVRYPGPQFDYSAGALAAFREAVAPELTPVDRARLDARLVREPLVYADYLPVRWAQYRRARLADLVARLRRAVKARRPEAWLSAAVIPDADEAFRDRLQDWPDWARRGLIDAICPMAYTASLTRFTRQIEDVERAASGQPVWAGIGAWRLRPAQIVQHIGAARAAGADGTVLFSYDSLTENERASGALRAIGRATALDLGAPVASTR